jgi:hypothetical protein
VKGVGSYLGEAAAIACCCTPDTNTDRSRSRCRPSRVMPGKYRLESAKRRVQWATGRSTAAEQKIAA